MRWWIEYTVEGQGYFPVDMLRYDRSWPHRQADVGLIDIPEAGRVHHGMRQVDLCMCGQTSKDGPTEARWQSFGWRVVRITPRKM